MGYSKSTSDFIGEHAQEYKYIFVNEVLKSDILQTLQHCRDEGMYDSEHTPVHTFEKHYFEGSHQLTEADYIEDTHGRKYRTVKVSFENGQDEYVADESLVVPRYLIVIGSKPNYFLDLFKDGFLCLIFIKVF